MQTVGVAPGTTTLSLKGLRDVYPGVAAKSINWIKPRPCPPEEKRWMIFDRASDGSWIPAHPNGFKGLSTRYYDPYANDIWKLRGLRGQDRIRWDLIGIVGGGALAVTLITGFLAAKL